MEENLMKSLRTNLHVDINSISINMDGGMRIGTEYQADLPDCSSTSYIKHNGEPLTIMVWHPNIESLDPLVDNYLEIAAEKYGYNQEQALGLLFWHRHNIDKSLADLPSFVPIPEHWDIRDQVLFEQAFSFYGKNFHRMRSMIPDKSVGSLVKYYYSWKRLRNKTSRMDIKDDFEKLISPRTNSISSESLKDSETKSTIYIQSKIGNKWNKRCRPNVHLDASDLHQIATIGSDDFLKRIESELLQLQRKVISMKASINHYKLKNNLSIDHLRPVESMLPINPKWSQEEMLLCVLGFGHYGMDYAKIAETIGTKTEGLVRDFYHNYKHRYNLDFAISEYQREHSKENHSKNKSQLLPENKISTNWRINEKYISKDDKPLQIYHQDHVTATSNSCMAFKNSIPFNPTLDLGHTDHYDHQQSVVPHTVQSNSTDSKNKDPILQRDLCRDINRDPNRESMCGSSSRGDNINRDIGRDLQRDGNQSNYQSQFDRYNHLRSQYSADNYAK